MVAWTYCRVLAKRAGMNSNRVLKSNRLKGRLRCADESIPIVLSHLSVLPLVPNEELVTSQGLRIDQHSIWSATHTAGQNIPRVQAIESFVEIIIGGDRGALESCTNKCSLAP